jgi:PepSY-associated TM region
MKRWLFLAHRWMGVFGCLLVTLWFLSGFVMMYVPFPALTDAERLAALPALTEPAVTPSEALRYATSEAAGDRVQQLRLVQPDRSGVYAVRFERAGWMGIDARSGTRLRVDDAQARRAAERFAGHHATALELIELDQWSVSSSLDPHRPLWAVHMADGGLHHVSSRTGEVLRDTARAERGWNWVGAVVHWVYPTVLRSEPRLWHWAVVVLATYALITALLGTVVGVWRWRRYANGRRSPYVGWMRWHHLLGLGGAVFVIAWLLSGLLSMNPFDVFSTRRLAAHQISGWSGSDWAPTLPAPTALRGSTKEVEWLLDRDGTIAWLRTSPVDSQLWQQHLPLQVSEGFIRARLEGLSLGEVQRIERLDALDLHYHARSAPRPLPIWRVRFNDEQETWVHVDGQSGQPFARIDASNRAGRWLYHGLHSWDFAFLLERRPLWDALMLAAMALGTALSVTSVVLAWRRVRPRPQRTAATEARPPVAAIAATASD